MALNSLLCADVPLRTYTLTLIHKKKTVIFYVHQLQNNSILYQVVCAALSIKYSMVLSSRYSDASVVCYGNKHRCSSSHSNWRHTLRHT